MIYAYPENLAQIRLLVSKLVKGVGGGFRGDLEEDGGVNFFPFLWLGFVNISLFLKISVEFKWKNLKWDSNMKNHYSNIRIIFISGKSPNRIFTANIQYNLFKYLNNLNICPNTGPHTPLWRRTYLITFVPVHCVPSLVKTLAS